MTQSQAKAKFLLDENLSPRFQAAVLRQNPQIGLTGFHFKDFEQGC
jgi:hypothetical protein